MSEQAKMWDHYQTEELGRFDGSQARLSYVVSRTPPHGRLLDIGVGAGQFERAALAARRDVHALDASEGAIRRLAIEFGLGEKARVGTVEANPFPDEYFACVVMSEVLEHLNDSVLEPGLDEVFRVLEPGGLFIGTVPANERLSESLVYCPTCNSTFHRWGHVRSYSSESLRRTLERRFVVRDLHERLFVNWSALNWRGRIVSALQTAALRAGISPQQASLFFIAEKGPLVTRDATASVPNSAT